jgi:hypothetical protein
MLALSSVTVTSTAEWHGEMNMLIAPEGGTAEDGGG